MTIHPLRRLRERREAKARDRARVLTNEELTEVHWADHRLFRWLAFGLALFVVAALAFGLGQRQQNDHTDKALAKINQVQAQQLYDRCLARNTNRTFIAGNNAGMVHYIDTLLAAFATITPPAGALTPDQRTDQLRVTAALAKARQDQLNRNNDPALAISDCGKPPPGYVPTNVALGVGE